MGIINRRVYEVVSVLKVIGLVSCINVRNTKRRLRSNLLPHILNKNKLPKYINKSEFNF